MYLYVGNVKRVWRILIKMKWLCKIFGHKWKGFWYEVKCHNCNGDVFYCVRCGAIKCGCGVKIK
jgi:hypothetical protein